MPTGVRKMIAPRKWIVKQYTWGEEYARKDTFRHWLFWLFVAAAVCGVIGAAL